MINAIQKLIERSNFILLLTEMQDYRHGKPIETHIYTYAEAIRKHKHKK